MMKGFHNLEFCASSSSRDQEWKDWTAKKCGEFCTIDNGGLPNSRKILQPLNYTRVFFTKCFTWQSDIPFQVLHFLFILSDTCFYIFVGWILKFREAISMVLSCISSVKSFFFLLADWWYLQVVFLIHSSTNKIRREYHFPQELQHYLGLSLFWRYI